MLRALIDWGRTDNSGSCNAEILALLLTNTAGKAQPVQSGMVDEFPEEGYKMVELHLQDKTFSTVDDVLKALYMT